MNYEHETKQGFLRFGVFGTTAVALGGLMAAAPEEASAQAAVSPTQDRGLYVVSTTNVPRTPLPGGIRQRDTGGIREPMPAGIRQPDGGGIREPMAPGIREPMPQGIREPATGVPPEPATTGSTGR